MTRVYSYQNGDTDTLLRVDLTANATAQEIAAGSTITDANVPAGATYTTNGFNAFGGSGGQGINVTFGSSDATTLADTGSVLFEIEGAMLNIGGQTNDDYMFTFGTDAANPAGSKSQIIPALFYNCGSGGDDAWYIQQDYHASNGLSEPIQFIITGGNFSFPATVKCLWTWNTTNFYLWVNGLLVITGVRSLDAARATVYQKFTIAGYGQAGGRAPANAIRRVQVLKRHIPVPTEAITPYVGYLGSSFFAGSQGQCVHPQFRSADQALYWADDAGSGFASAAVGAADIVNPDSASVGFEHGISAQIAKQLAEKGSYPIFINRAQNGGEVKHATGVSSPATTSETMTAGHYLKLKADTATAGGTVPESVFCDFGTNEIANSTSLADFENNYKSLIRAMSTDGIKFAVCNTVLSMTLSATYSATTNDDDVLAFNEVILGLPAWAKAQGLSIKVLIADTFTAMNGYDPDQDNFNTTDIHPNAVGGDIQAGVMASAFDAGVLLISSGSTGIGGGTIGQPTLGADGYLTSQSPDNTLRQAVLGADGYEVPDL